MNYVMVTLGNIAKEKKTMTDEYLLERGYKQYKPTQFDNESVVARFQKRFDDDFGKKYFIDVLKWSHDYVPVNKRDKWWKPFTYCYETQVSMFKEEKSLNLEFFSDWTLEEVEKYMEEMFEKMKLNYYESWSGERRTRPQIRESIEIQEGENY